MKMSKYLLKLACLGVAVSCGFSVQAQEVNRKIDDMTFAVYGAPSHLINVLDIYGQLITSYNYVGVGAQTGFLMRHSDNWYDKAYNFPELGVGVWWQPYGSALTFKNDSRLGNMLNLYGYGTWNLLRSQSFTLGPTAKIGVALSGSKYDPVTNPANQYIGTNLEYLVSAGLETSVRLSNKFSLNLAAMLTHHSNGKQGVPNLGLNEACIHFGVKYYPGGITTKSEYASMLEKDYEKPVIEQKLTISPYFATGIHSCERIWTSRGCQGSAPIYQRVMAGVDLDFRYHPIFSSGIGLDLTYTPNVQDLRSCDEREYPEEYPSLKYCPVYCGIAAFQQFHYKQFEIHFRLGYYVFKELGKIEDWGRFYQKIGFSYTFNNNLYLGFDMLAVRFDSSDCLEFSIGYRFPLRKR